ncbi:MAG: multiple sugar transport system ATP-binding protein [Sphingomonadales bacterium]|jgi:multiple sugar transport system ATP-binding protein|nr:multiple sugar transport system ATP-binding protein [Sphingomonadales bacterium]
MASIELQRVGKSFGQTAVLTDVDLRIEEGEFLVLVGPSGCGKSTLLRLLAGLEEVDSGDILIGGTRVNDLPPAKRGIAMVFQSYALYPHMTVRENMAFGLRLAGESKAAVAAAVDKAAALLEIEPLLDRRPKMLSGGQRQRVAIGRAIVREPTVFLFDEPLSNLDAELRVRMRYEFARLHQRLKTTTVYVTHDQVEAMTLADRIAILDRGRVVQFGTAAALYEHPATLFVAGFIGSPRMNFLDGVVVGAGDDGVRVRLQGDAELRAAVAAGSAKPGDAVTLGIRPEDLRPGAGGLAASVTLIESLGNIRFAYLDSAATRDPLIVQLAPGERLAEQDKVTLAARPEACHLFDAEGRAFPRAMADPGSIAA